MDIETGAVKMVSTGAGVTTCSFFLYPECEKVVYSSTHLGDKSCPKKQNIARDMFGSFIQITIFF